MKNLQARKECISFVSEVNDKDLEISGEMTGRFIDKTTDKEYTAIFSSELSNLTLGAKFLDSQKITINGEGRLLYVFQL